MRVLLEHRLLKQVSVSVKSSTSIFLVCAKDLGIGILCHVHNLQNSACPSRQFTAFSPLKSYKPKFSLHGVRECYYFLKS